MAQRTQASQADNDIIYTAWRSIIQGVQKPGDEPYSVILKNGLIACMLGLNLNRMPLN